MKNHIHLPLIISCAALVACQGPQSSTMSSGTNSNSASVIGGEVVKSDDALANVAVLIYLGTGDTVQGICSGTLFDADWVVTAAHCFVAEKGIKPLAVVFADHRQVHVKRYVVNPDFSMETLESDIAVVQLTDKQPGPYAQLADRDFTLPAGTNVEVAGYGLDSLDGDGKSGQLKKVQETIVNYNEGKNWVKLSEPVDQGDCFGDSGGPGYIVKDGKVIVWGADSHADPEVARRLGLACGVSSVYTRVSALRDWIDSAQKPPAAPTAPSFDSFLGVDP